MKLVMILAVAAAAPNATLVRTPGGWVPAACVMEVANGARVEGERLAECAAAQPAHAMQHSEQIYAMNTAAEKESYWSSFTADWIVPELPSAAKGQTVYFWPGFKSQEPVMGYPVLQPVLQYGQSGPHWELQSWFVHGGAVSEPL